MLSLFTHASVFSVTPASLAEIGRAYGATDTQLGLLVGALMLGFFATVVAAGRSSDKYGRMPVLTAGMAMMATGSIAFALSGSYHPALASCLLIGLGGGCIEGVASAAVSDLYPGKGHTAMMNWAQVCWSLGAVVAPLGVSWALGYGINWRAGYVVVAGMSAACAVLTYTAHCASRGLPALHEYTKGEWISAFRSPFVLWLCVGIFIYVGAEGSQASWAALMLEGLGAKSSTAAASVGLFWAGISAGRVVATWTSRRLSDIAIVCWSLALGVVAQSAALLAKDPMVALCLVFVVGLCIGPVWPTTLSIAARAFPGKVGTVYGAIIAFGGLGGTLIPASLGRLADALHAYSPAYGIAQALWVCALLHAVNLALYLNVRRIAPR